MTLDAGGGHTCALLITGEVKCWGRNIYGQLGLGDAQDRRAPARLAGVADVVAVAALVAVVVTVADLRANKPLWYVLIQVNSPQRV